MQKLDPQSAAEQIRGEMEQPAAEDRHTETFVNAVLDRLGLEHSIANANRVMDALHRHDIQPHQIAEYPKHVKVKDAEGRDKVVVVNSEDEEHKANEDAENARSVNDPAYSGTEPGYPKKIMVRGTDGVEHPQIVRDLKEERELRGIGVSAIDPEASTQFKKAGLRPPTAEEEGRAAVTSRGGEMQQKALDQANAAKTPQDQRIGAAQREEGSGDTGYSEDTGDGPDGEANTGDEAVHDDAGDHVGEAREAQTDPAAPTAFTKPKAPTRPAPKPLR